MASSSFLPLSAESSEPPATPNFIVGAASPLWAVFGGAAAAGAAWWWWSSRWREAVNLEALLAIAPEPVSRGVIDAPPSPLVATPVEVVEAVVAEVEPIVETVAAATLEVAETAAEVPAAVAEASVEVVGALVEAAPEPEIVAPEIVADLIAEPAEAVVEETLEAAANDAAPPEVAPVLAPVEAKAIADDLTQLVGIGPKLAASLAELGVTRFHQIADWSADELASFDKLLSLKGRAQRDAWVAQAKRLAEQA
ncbi:MAG: hypothetical protein QM608_13545 [Caulobacter sp.]